LQGKLQSGVDPPHKPVVHRHRVNDELLDLPIKQWTLLAGVFKKAPPTAKEPAGEMERCHLLEGIRPVRPAARRDECLRHGIPGASAGIEMVSSQKGD
jgi:hypothetical protein